MTAVTRLDIFWQMLLWHRGRDELRSDFMAALSGLLSKDLKRSLSSKLMGANAGQKADKTGGEQMLEELLRA